MSRLVLLHGFTQTGASWAGITRVLAEHHEVRSPDLPGHGSRAAVRAGLWEGAALVARTEGDGVYVGYSMGGRMALHVALGHAAVVRGLVLVSATGGIDDADERAARSARDADLAVRIEHLGIETFLDEWLAQPMFAGLPASAREGRSTDPEGLVSSLLLAGAGAQDPLWDRLHEIDVPVLVVAGERDRKYVDLAERLARALPRSELSVLPDAGHALHLERPAAFVDMVESWLARHEL